MPINLYKAGNDYGLMRGEFRDAYDRLCVIQESSVPDTLWLGTVTDQEPAARMCLTVENVEVLLPLLKRFIEKGNLRE